MIPAVLCLNALTIHCHYDVLTLNEMQQENMERLVCVHECVWKPVPLRMAGLIVRPEIAKHCCGWSCVSCTNSEVTSIRWKYKRIEELDIRWVPATVNHIIIEGIPVRGELETRFLPRSLCQFFARDCQMSGTPDMASLPAPLSTFEVPDNALTGTLCLSNLPNKLETVDFSRNHITKVFYMSENLPSSLNKVMFEQNNNIKWICPNKDNRIFFIQMEHESDSAE